MLQQIALLAFSCSMACAQSIPIQVLKQSPADTNTDLQVICLFRSSPENILHGALIETNERLNGLLDRILSEHLLG